MELTGTWNLEGTNETLTINDPQGTDNYLFEFSDQNKGNERVSIYFSTDRHALLTKSKVYGRADIFIFGNDEFAIEDQKFKRVL